MEQVVIIGHSFVREMLESDFSLNLKVADVLYVGYLGDEKLNLLPQLKECKHELVSEMGVTQLVFLMLGSNDLISDHTRAPESVASDLVDVATFLLSNGVQKVVLMEVLPRFGKAVSRGRAAKFANSTGLTDVGDLEVEFGRRMTLFNKHLKESAEVTQGLLYMKVQGFHFDEPANFRPCGILLNTLGMERLRVAMRKKAIVELLRCQGKGC